MVELGAFGFVVPDFAFVDFDAIDSGLAGPAGCHKDWAEIQKEKSVKQRETIAVAPTAV